MSLILDALRKSEHDRHGAADSVLPLIVTPRSGGRRKQRRALLPLAIMLLAVVVLAAVFLFRERIFAPSAEHQPPALAAPRSLPQRLPQQQLPQQQQQQPQQQAPSPPPGEGRAAQISRQKPAEPSAPASSSVAPADAASASDALPGARIPASATANQVKPPAGATTVARRAPPTGPATPAPSVPATPVEETTPAALSTFPADFIRQVQPLHLDFHVYSADASRRMVYINNREYEEGDQLKRNLKILRIVPEGAVMQWQQQPFLLTARD